MVVAVDSIDTASNSSGAVTSLDLTTLTVGAGANRALVAFLVTETSASSPVLHWDSAGSNQLMTLIGNVSDASGSSTVWAFGLIAPTSGNKNLHVTWTGAADGTIAAACFTGVDQTGGTTSFAHASFVQGTTAQTASKTVTSAVGNYTLGVFADGSASPWSANNQTLWFHDSGTLSFAAMGESATGAATVTYNGTGSTGANYAFGGVDIVATGGAAAAPFGSGSSSLVLPPRSKKGSASLAGWVDPVKLNLIGKDTFFGGPGRGPTYDYPNPRGRIPPVALRTWIDQLKLTLLGKDTFFGLGGAPQFDWPNPQRRERSAPIDWVAPYNIALNEPVVVMPFSMDDWPNPRGPRYASELRSFLGPLGPQITTAIQVAIDNVASTHVQSNAATTISLASFTVGIGANRALIAALTLQPAATSPTVTWDTAGTPQPLQPIMSVTDTGNAATTYLFALLGPTSGNKNLTASWTGTSQVILAAASFTGVNQGGGQTSFTGFTSTGASSTGPNTVNITSAIGNYCLGVWEGFINFSSVSSTQWYIDNASTTISSIASHGPGAALVAFTENGTGTARPWGFVGLDLIAADDIDPVMPPGDFNIFPNPAPRTRPSVSLLTWIDTYSRGGTVTPLTLSVDVAVPSALINQTGKLLTDVVISPASIIRDMSKTLSSSVISPSLLIRQTSKNISNTVTSVGLTLTPRTSPLTFTNTITSTASLLYTLGKQLLNTVTSVASLTRQTGKLLTRSVTSTGSLVRQTGKLLTNTVTSVASLSRQMARLLTSSVTSTASLIRQLNKLFANTVTSTATLSRQMGRTLSNAVTSVATLVRQTNKILTNTVTSVGSILTPHISPRTLTNTVTVVASVLYTLGRPLLNTVTSTATLIRQTGKLVLNTVTSVASVTKQLSRTIANTVAVTASITKQLARTLLNTVTAVATETHAHATSLSFTNTVTSVAKLIRQTGKPLLNAVTSVASRALQTSKPLLNTVTSIALRISQTNKPLSSTLSSVATLTALKSFNRTLTNTVTLVATLTRQTGKLLTDTVTSVATLNRQTGKLILNTVSSVAILIRQTNKPLTRTVTSTATLTFLRVALVNLNVTITSVASMLWQKGMTLSNTVSVTASKVMQTSKTLTNSVISTTLLSRLTSRTMLVTTQGSAIRILQAGKTLATISQGSGSILYQFGKTVFIGVSSIASLRRTSSKTSLATSVPLATLARQTGKTLLNSVTSVASAATNFISGGIVLVATTSPIATLTAVRNYARTLSVVTAPIGVLSRSTALFLAVASTVIAKLFSGGSNTPDNGFWFDT